MLASIKFFDNIFSKTTVSKTSVADHLIAESQKTRPFYHLKTVDYLSNHLSMALIALKYLKASDKQMVHFDKYYREQLMLQDYRTDYPKHFIRTENLMKFVGQYEMIEGIVENLRSQLKESTIFDLIKKYVPQLSSGIGSEAFHCIIQMAYGVLENNKYDEEQLLQGLAYLFVQQVQVDRSKFSENTKGVQETLVELNKHLAHFKEVKTFDYPVVFNDQLGAILKDKLFQSIVPKHFEQPENLLEELTVTLVKVFIETESFLILHGVTGLHSLKKILPLVKAEDRRQIVDYFLQHLMAAYVCTDLNALTPEQKANRFPIPELPSWKQIISETVKSDDDHDIKLVYINYLEYQAFEHNKEVQRILQYASAIRMKMIKSVLNH